ncbi:MAG: hypothetical protein JWM61_1704 [Micrococcaceae bacterium]|nr:hypothetical protein [Micrococcaceae bacterium]
MKKWLLVLVLATSAAIVAGLLVWAPWKSTMPVAAPSSPAAVGPSSPATVVPSSDTTQRDIQQVSTGDGWSASASFPENPDLRATVQQVTPNEEQLLALPTATNLVALAEYELVDAAFPVAGAMISFTLDQPVADDHVAAIAHWNEADKLWEPVGTNLSEDRRTVTAVVNHFSQYGFFDYLFNAVGQVTGNAATSGVTCDQPIPSWADPQYFDDINSPVLWCGGRDANNADLLVAKLKMNRNTAARVTLAIDPAWAWSDMWQGSPTDLATMAISAELPSNPFSSRQYLVQPFGELHFGFDRTDLEDLYYGENSKPLIQVETGWFYTATGIMWDQLSGVTGADSPIAALSSTMAMLNCGMGLLDTTSQTSAVDNFRDSLTCLGTQQSKDLVNRGVRTVLADRYPHLTSGWITVHSRTILSKFALLGAGFQIASMSVRVMSAIGDATLPESVRQFRYEPSLEAIKDRVTQKPTYRGNQMGTDYSFTYPRDWKVVEKPEEGYSSSLIVLNSVGDEVASLDILSTWGATAMQGQLRPVARIENQPSTGSMSALGAGPGTNSSENFSVRTVIMDLTANPSDVSTFGWERPVAVAVSASQKQEASPASDLSQLFPYLLYGVGAIDAQSNPNGEESAVVIFQTTRYFDTLQDAEAWTLTTEYQRLVEMISSFDG